MTVSRKRPKAASIVAVDLFAPLMTLLSLKAHGGDGTGI
jgi:hypothetical protein